MFAIEQSMYFLAIVGLLSTVLAAFYYLRLIKIIYFDKPKQTFEKRSQFWVERLTLAVSTGILVLYFIYPGLAENELVSKNYSYLMKLKKYEYKSVTSTNDIAIKNKTRFI